MNKLSKLIASPYAKSFFIIFSNIMCGILCSWFVYEITVSGKMAISLVSLLTYFILIGAITAYYAKIMENEKKKKKAELESLEYEKKALKKEKKALETERQNLDIETENLKKQKERIEMDYTIFISKKECLNAITKRYKEVTQEIDDHKVLEAILTDLWEGK